jgi:hypothetical protein
MKRTGRHWETEKPLSKKDYWAVKFNISEFEGYHSAGIAIFRAKECGNGKLYKPEKEGVELRFINEFDVAYQRSYKMNEILSLPGGKREAKDDQIQKIMVKENRIAKPYGPMFTADREFLEESNFEDSPELIDKLCRRMIELSRTGKLDVCWFSRGKYCLIIMEHDEPFMKIAKSFGVKEGYSVNCVWTLVLGKSETKRQISHFSKTVLESPLMSKFLNEKRPVGQKILRYLTSVEGAKSTTRVSTSIAEGVKETHSNLQSLFKRGLIRKEKIEISEIEDGKPQEERWLAKNPVTGWNCPRCTYFNNSSASKCTLCTTDKVEKRKKVKSTIKIANWEKRISKLCEEYMKIRTEVIRIEGGYYCKCCEEKLAAVKASTHSG